MLLKEWREAEKQTANGLIYLYDNDIIHLKRQSDAWLLDKALPATSYKFFSQKMKKMKIGRNTGLHFQVKKLAAEKSSKMSTIAEKWYVQES